MTTMLTCRLNVLDAGQRARYAASRQAVRVATRHIMELSDGYALDLGFDPDAFLKAAEWISLERHCCPFLNFGLELKDDGAVSLSLTGPGAVKAFLDGEMRLLDHRTAATSVPTAPAIPPAAKPTA
jgi:hypothetical protein